MSIDSKTASFAVFSACKSRAAAGSIRSDAMRAVGSVAGDVARAAERPVLVARGLYAGAPLPPTEAASAS